MDLVEATPRTRAALTRQQQQVIKYASKESKLSLNRQHILSEEDYVEGLERIIARDFFPMLSASMEHRRKELNDEIMQGFSSEDPDVIERSVRRIEDWLDTTPAWSVRYSKRNQSRTPKSSRTFNGGTPPRSQSQAGQAGPSDKGHDRGLPYDSKLSLDEYQAKYTSEDNASFAEILDSENATRRKKYAWAYEAEQVANNRARRAIEAREKLVDLAKRLADGDSDIKMIEGGPAGRPGERILVEGRSSLPGDKASLEFAKRRLISAPARQARLLIKGSSDQNTEQSSKDGALVPLTAEQKELQLSKAMKDNAENIDKTLEEEESASNLPTWKAKARNSLYFAPDANIPVHQMAVHPLNRKRPVESVDELGITEPKSIRYANTRLFSQEELEQAAKNAGVPPSPSHSNIAAAISGKPYEGRSSAAMTPRVQGYSFVDAMPSPSPSSLGDSGLNMLMTFGTLESTPVPLRNSNKDDPANALSKAAASEALKEGPFKIPAAPKRDLLAHELAGKATKSLQQRHGLRHNTGLGLRANSGSVRGSNTPGGWGETPQDRVKRAMKEVGGQTPSKDAFLSPAAKTLLGRTGSVKRGVEASPIFGQAHRRNHEERERQGMEKVKRAKWD